MSTRRKTSRNERSATERRASEKSPVSFGPRWAYAADHKSPWAFERGVDRVSHLTMLLYLNDDFAGGATTLFDDDGGPDVPVAPTKGSALCFWQSFKLGRGFRCRDSAHAPLHEGSPVTAGPSPKYSVRTDVLFTFPTSGEPPAR